MRAGVGVGAWVPLILIKNYRHLFSVSYVSEFLIVFMMKAFLDSKIFFKSSICPGMEAHTYDSSTGETKAVRLLELRE